jgi:hypothetical protein
VEGIKGKTVIDATNLYGVVPPDGFPSNARVRPSSASSFRSRRSCSPGLTSSSSMAIDEVGVGAGFAHRFFVFVGAHARNLRKAGSARGHTGTLTAPRRLHITRSSSPVRVPADDGSGARQSDGRCRE